MISEKIIQLKVYAVHGLVLTGVGLAGDPGGATFTSSTAPRPSGMRLLASACYKEDGFSENTSDYVNDAGSLTALYQ